MSQSPTLYERLGGVYSIATVVEDLIDRIMVDSRFSCFSCSILILGVRSRNWQPACKRNPRFFEAGCLGVEQRQDCVSHVA